MKYFFIGGLWGAVVMFLLMIYALENICWEETTQDGQHMVCPMS
jgi:hypothetical protein